VTAPLLLAWIAAACLLQVMAALGIALWRRSRAAVQVPPAARAERDTPPPAWEGWRGFSVARRVPEDEAGSQCSFQLVPQDGQALPPFQPGQYLTLRLPAPPGGGGGAARTLVRCYSLSDRPQPEGYRITVKRVPAGADGSPPGAASNHLHDQVPAGTVLMVQAPAGRFCIDAASDLPVVLIAGGIGITPMISMLGWLLQAQPERGVSLYYGVRRGDEHAFKDWLAAQAAQHPQLRLHLAYSQPAASDLPGRDYQHSGHIDIELLRRTLPPGRQQFYVCGPAAMMASLVPALAAWGVPESDLRFEAFGPATVRTLLPAQARLGAALAPIAVEFRRSERTLEWDGGDATLLDFAERHGIVVDSGCRSGGCGACQTALLSGAVLYASVPDFSPDAGHCLLCVGRPAGAVALDA
jgi:hypothetical protein